MGIKPPIPASAAASPLAGKRILVTRPHGQARRLVDMLAAERAIPVEVPVIQIKPPESWAPMDAAIAEGRYDWVVFTSANGVRSFLERLAFNGRDPGGSDPGWFGDTRVAAIGPETARVLREGGVPTQLVPDEYVAEALVASIADSGPLSGRRILLPRADIARDALETGLTRAGAIVEKVVAYRTVPADTPPGLLQRLESGEIDVVTFTSSSTVRGLVGMLGGSAALLQRATIACIGPITAATATELGLHPSIVASTYTVDGLMAALRAFYVNSDVAINR